MISIIVVKRIGHNCCCWFIWQSIISFISLVFCESKTNFSLWMRITEGFQQLHPMVFLLAGGWRGRGVTAAVLAPDWPSHYSATKKGPKVSWTTSHWPRKLPLATFPFLAACFWSRVLESALEMRKIHQRRCKWLFLEEETGSNWNLDVDYEKHNIRYKMRLIKGIFLTT